MIPGSVMAVFFGASVLLALAPGPDNIFVLTQSAIRGRAAGIVVTFGLCTGLVVHTAAVALGIAAVVQASVLAFTILKCVGAAYLLYLAWQAFRASAGKLGSEGSPALPLRRLYRRGIIMNLSNPKVSIFFLAFLPQFADPARGSLVLQLAMLGMAFMVATIIVFGAIAMLAGTLGQWFGQSARAQRVMNRVTAAVLAGLALRLAVSWQ
jgi:threonine/homoserine/homoserine lactone efflux protein